jgi:hypothetical protein
VSQPRQHLAGARHSPQLSRECVRIRGADALSEVRRQLPAQLGLDASDHARHADAGVAGDAFFGGAGNADGGEFTGQHPRGDDLGIDEDAVAIEDHQGIGAGSAHLQI